MAVGGDGGSSRFFIEHFNFSLHSFQIFVFRASAAPLETNRVIEAVGAGVHDSTVSIFSAIAHITLTVTPFPACL